MVLLVTQVMVLLAKQVMVLLVQHYKGPRFFVPRRSLLLLYYSQA